MKIFEEAGVVGVVQRVGGPIAKAACATRTEHAAGGRQDLLPKPRILRRVWKVPLELLRRYAAEPASDGAALAQLIANDRVDDGLIVARAEFAVVAGDLPPPPQIEMRASFGGAAVVAHRLATA